jgi:hypothetical protein
MFDLRDIDFFFGLCCFCFFSNHVACWGLTLLVIMDFSYLFYLFNKVFFSSSLSDWDIKTIILVFLVYGSFSFLGEICVRFKGFFFLWTFIHYNNRGLFCNPHIIANNKEKSFRKPAFANHNSSQTIKPLRYHNIRTCTIASPSQLPNLIQSQNLYDYNCFYIPFAINITSETICSKPIVVTT